MTTPSDPPQQQEGEGGSDAPRQAGGGRIEPTPTGGNRRLILLGLADGKTSLQAIAKRLGLPKSTVLDNRDSLLSDGALERSSTPPGWFYCKGPAYEAILATLGGSEMRARGVVQRARQAPRGFGKVTRGPRGIDLLEPPAAPNLLPGYVRTIPQVPPSYVYAWEFEGRIWPIRMYRRSVQISAPKPRMRARDVPGKAEIQERWTDYASKVLHRWAQEGGVHLSRDRQAVREQAPVELEIARVNRQEGALSSDGLVEINGTPDPGTMETTSEEIAEEVSHLPFTMPAHRRAIESLAMQVAEVQRDSREVKALMPGIVDSLRDLADVDAGMAAGLVATARAIVKQAGHTARAMGATASPSPPASPASSSPGPSPYDGSAYA